MQTSNGESTGETPSISFEAVEPVAVPIFRHGEGRGERILLPIADSLAEKLFKKRSAMFIQKHYNDLYPLVSLIEDGKNTIRF